MPERTLVTSALPYANGRVHIGHLAGAYLPADIYVRYLRACGRDVLFICGSDEHGVPITLRAREEAVSPQDVIDTYHPANDRAFHDVGVRFDIFGRTSSTRNHKITQAFFRKLYDEGRIRKKTIRQFYSEASRMFLPDRYVVGTCPHEDCGNENARGDQCDACTRTYEAHELKNPRTNLPGDASTPVLRETDHWFLELGHFEPALTAWLDRRQGWRDNAMKTAREWIRRGLLDRCITRDTTWGVPIPLDDPDTEGKRIYVWFDAPIGYVTNTAEVLEGRGEPEGWRRWWQDDGTRLVHFIGKDNIPFHAIIFPAMLLGQGDYILPDNVVSNEYLNFKGRKASKSVPGSFVEIGAFLRRFAADPLRYYLTAIAPEGRDTDFYWEDFQTRNNSELADTLGNFINRGFKFAEKYFDAKVPPLGDPSADAREILEHAAGAAGDVGNLLDAFKFKQGLERLMEFARACNVYIDRAAPWKTRKTDPAGAGRTIRACLELNAALCGLMRPFLPFTADAVAAAFGEAGTIAPIRGEDGYWAAIGRERLSDGAVLGDAAPLFAKIDDASLADAVRKVNEEQE